MPGVKSCANVNPLWFSARAGDGTTCKAALGAVDGQIKAGEPATGAIVKGSLGFDVTGGLFMSIRYDSPLGERLGTWTIGCRRGTSFTWRMTTAST
ncbi:hypothetical protein [Rhodococcus koreensis]|uniref:hypothetical protein n=1 Tax=Rhodococcus koreensis TaxID=99653 RepID=UPI003B847B44